MAVRSSMAALIARMRGIINDPAGANQIFDDQSIQNIFDESRQDIYNQPLDPHPTFTGGTILYLDYYAPTALGDWEDDIVLKQYLTVTVTPATVDDITGHWTFAATTLPPVFITGKTYDIYRAAADLLERWAARQTFKYDVSADGQSLHRSQAMAMLLKLAQSYRLKQRAHVLNTYRGDVNPPKSKSVDLLGPKPIDYMASG